MKRRIIARTALALLSGAVVSNAQTLINSWENSPEGWSILETGTWTSDGFVTSNNTQGSYSWKLTSTGVDYGDTLRGPSSTGLTAIMANAASVNMDIVIDPTAPSFAWGIQLDLAVNQPGGIGEMSVSNSTYPGGVFGNALTNGSTNTLTFPVSQTFSTALDAYPNLPCYLILKVGGGAGGTMYIDNLRANLIPEPTGLFVFGGFTLLAWNVIRRCKVAAHSNKFTRRAHGEDLRSFCSISRSETGTAEAPQP